MLTPLTCVLTFDLLYMITLACMFVFTMFFFMYVLTLFLFISPMSVLKPHNLELVLNYVIFFVPTITKSLNLNYIEILDISVPGHFGTDDLDISVLGTGHLGTGQFGTWMRQ
jgi:hypothetical protein